MDRYEVPIDDRLAPLVEAAARGDEVVIVREGEVVARLAPAHPVSPPAHARMSMRESLERFREATREVNLPVLTPTEAARLVRDMRDEVD